jgi:hypothetical protein
MRAQPCHVHTLPAPLGLTPYQVACESSGQGPSANMGTDSRMPPWESQLDCSTGKAFLSLPLEHKGLRGTHLLHIFFPS